MLTSVDTYYPGRDLCTADAVSIPLYRLTYGMISNIFHANLAWPQTPVSHRLQTSSQYLHAIYHEDSISGKLIDCCSVSKFSFQLSQTQESEVSWFRTSLQGIRVYRQRMSSRECRSVSIQRSSSGEVFSIIAVHGLTNSVVMQGWRSFNRTVLYSRCRVSKYYVVDSCVIHANRALIARVVANAC